jgi:Flp pilus assembly protein protease CpaA
MDQWVVYMIVAELVFVGWLVWVILHYRHRRERTRAEERDRLLARFTTAQELSDFLSSPGGERFFNDQARAPRHAARKLASAITSGVILLFLGIAFFVMGWVGNPAGDRIFVPATILTMIGLGVLVSAAISTRLLKRSGLLPRNGEGRGPEQS